MNTSHRFLPNDRLLHFHDLRDLVDPWLELLTFDPVVDPLKQVTIDVFAFVNFWWTKRVNQLTVDN